MASGEKSRAKYMRKASSERQSSGRFSTSREAAPTILLGVDSPFFSAIVLKKKKKQTASSPEFLVVF